ncbi:hypothetical protein EH240_27770 [Mesorhizobium tamadayense]|uniref:Uncharacterized protein n=1 Tax=Mesorhizobium tamadayense TaxID=425306 RepID=A0A3P3F6L3_9HYPH|nr:hypothetical protein [Mesorhizobium tamadayense]RRH94274.1 hypothetical protein EH240_27770 [Mesorhizobium tamadayense]
MDKTSKVKRGQPIELVGEVIRIDEETVTIDLSPAVTVARDKVRLVRADVPPKRKTAPVDKPT